MVDFWNPVLTSILIQFSLSAKCYPGSDDFGGHTPRWFYKFVCKLKVLVRFQSNLFLLMVLSLINAITFGLNLLTL